MLDEYLVRCVEADVLQLEVIVGSLETFGLLVIKICFVCLLIYAKIRYCQRIPATEKSMRSIEKAQADQGWPFCFS